MTVLFLLFCVDRWILSHISSWGHELDDCGQRSWGGRCFLGGWRLLPSLIWMYSWGVCCLIMKCRRVCSID